MQNVRFDNHHLGSQPLPTIYSYPLPKFDFAVTSCSLQGSTIEVGQLQAFLSLFKSMKRFEYRFDYDPEAADHMMWHPSFDPTWLPMFLEHLSGSLEELAVTADGAYSATAQGTPLTPLTSFASLRKSRHLQLH
jgi:hypothetical protein